VTRLTRRTAAALALGLVAACSGPTHPRATPAATTHAPTATAAPTPTASEVPDDPLSPRPALESPAPLGQPTCAPAALTVTDADSITSDRSVQEVFVLRTQGRACQLEGWPAVRLLDAAGRDLPVTVGHGGFDLPATAPAPVTLSRDTTASFLVATGRTGSCTDAATLVVTLPGTTTPLRADTTLSVCGGTVGVSPVQRLADVEGTGQTSTD
jgi:hypothetical protein